MAGKSDKGVGGAKKNKLLGPQMGRDEEEVRRQQQQREIEETLRKQGGGGYKGGGQSGQGIPGNPARYDIGKKRKYYDI